MTVNRKTLERIKSVLIHEVGDNRYCPHCKKSFVPDDRTSQDALELFNNLKAVGKAGTADFRGEIFFPADSENTPPSEKGLPDFTPILFELQAKVQDLEFLLLKTKHELDYERSRHNEKPVSPLPQTTIR